MDEQRPLTPPQRDFLLRMHGRPTERSYWLQGGQEQKWMRSFVERGLGRFEKPRGLDQFIFTDEGERAVKEIRAQNRLKRQRQAARVARIVERKTNDVVSDLDALFEARSRRGDA